MIEQALYFALGFCVAGLIALSAAPAVWARALRLTRSRLELLTPMDAREAAADRDHVRAEAALAVCRAEQALSAERDRRALDLVEIGRKTAAIAALEDRRAELEDALAERESDARRARADAVEAIGTQGAFAQMTASADAMRDDAIVRREATAHALAVTSALSESRRIAIATLETRAISDRAALEAANANAARLRVTLADSVREARTLADERVFLKDELARAETSRRQLAQRHAALTERLVQIEAELAAARDAARRAESQALRAGDLSDAAAARADETQASLEAAHVRLREHGAIAQEREARLSDRLEEARAEAAALRGALDEARRAAAAPAGRESDPGLRTLIAQIGRAREPDAAGETVAKPATPAPRSRPRRRKRADAATNIPRADAHHGGDTG